MDDFAGAEGFVQSPGAAYHPDHTRSESLWRTINRFVRSGTRGDARANDACILKITWPSCTASTFRVAKLRRADVSRTR